MPYKLRLAQAIRDEEAKYLQERVFHILGPGIVILAFIAFVGWLAVRVIKTPELFGGGAFDLIGYGTLGVAISLSLAKGYTIDKWLSVGQELSTAHLARIARIEAVITLMENGELEKTAGAPSVPDDPWTRALSPETPQEDTTTAA